MSSDASGSATSVDERLLELIDRGYRFMHPRDDEGRVVAVVGFRAHGAVVDVLRIHGEDDVIAFRIPGDEQNILDPRRVLWARQGAVHDVLDELVSLPEQQARAQRHVEVA